MTRDPRRRLRGDAGYSVLEAAITLPVIFLLTLFIVQWAIVWHARHVAEAAAQEALRTAEAYASSAAAGRQDGATFLSQTAPHMLLHPVITVHLSAAGVEVHVHATVRSVVPFGSWSVDADAAGPVERYISTP
jgi:Flp pilus assembly protein TadG